MKVIAPIAADRLFRAFSDQTRLRILTLLTRGEVCVCDIVSVLDIPQPTASRHLAYLRKSGLVEARKQGLWNYYSLTTPANDLHRCLLDCLPSCIASKPIFKRDLDRLTRSRSDCCG